jgi:predicted transcriptional regulator
LITIDSNKLLQIIWQAVGYIFYLHKSKISRYSEQDYTMYSPTPLEENANKSLKRIEWKLVKRLVILLYYSNKMKKTNLAMKCRIAYDKCIRYLNWLEMMDLIERRPDENGFETIVLSESGTDLYKRKLKNANYRRL